MLNPGRDCGDDHQCVNRFCKEGTCYGLDENENCNTHSDCQNGFYCRVSINWPFRAMCAGQKGAYENCTSDFECKNNMYCWYASPSDKMKNTTKCLPMYSQGDGTIFGWSRVSYDNPNKTNYNLTFDDYQMNGKYCQSGLAYPFNATHAKCTSMSSMMYKNDSLDAPYKCDPTDFVNKCRIKFNIDSDDATYTSISNRGYVEVPCKCSLGGPNDSPGFCSSVLGSDVYADAVAQLSNVLSSSGCHTLDRNDMRAQKDGCGIGVVSDSWRFAVDKMFNVTYWPYVQVSTAYNCISVFFADSYYNLILKTSTKLLASAVIAMGLTAAALVI